MIRALRSLMRVESGDYIFLFQSSLIGVSQYHVATWGGQKGFITRPRRVVPVCILQGNRFSLMNSDHDHSRSFHEIVPVHKESACRRFAIETLIDDIVRNIEYFVL